jgi:hypothetical protein
MHPLSTELALKAFDADAAFSADLAEFQANVPPGVGLIEAARLAARYGFASSSRPSEFGLIEVRLRHRSGADDRAEGDSIPELLAGLLGLVWPVEDQTAEAEKKCSLRINAAAAEVDLGLAQRPGPTEPAAAASQPVQVAAESLAAATSGVVVAEVGADPDPSTPLTAQQAAVCVQMIKDLEANQRNAFTKAFREAFRVDRNVKSIAPLISEQRHMVFCDCWTFEANGGVAS